MAVIEFLMDEGVDVKLLDYLGNPADAKGMATEITPPEQTLNMETDLRIGEGGEVNRPTTYAAMECSMTLKGISNQFWEFTSTAQAQRKELTIQVTGKGQDRYDSANVVDVKLVMKGYVMRNAFYSSMSTGEKSKLELSMGVNSITQQIGSTTVTFEPALKKYEINGVNQWV